MSDTGAVIKPDAYDLILLGTGLQESLLAAAASLAGLSVLHLDSESEYGSQWAGPNLQSFASWLQSWQVRSCTAQTRPSEHAKGLRADEAGGSNEVEAEQMAGDPEKSSLYTDVKLQSNASLTITDGRNFIVDMAPKVFYTAGPMPESLVRCKADGYLTFRLIPSFLWRQGQVWKVPCSRAEIFKDTCLAPAQKRLLMRFLKSALEALKGTASQQEKFDAKPFIQLLKEEGLPEELHGAVLYALACFSTAQGNVAAARDSQEGESPKTAEEHVSKEGGTASTPATSREALDRLAVYADSLSKYGGAFMVCDYGAGELPQAFCRVAAVHGATYALRCQIDSIRLSPSQDHCTGVRLASGQGAPDRSYVIVSGQETALQELQCKALACHSQFLPSHLVEANEGPGISRGVVVLEEAAVQDSFGRAGGAAEQMLLTLPPGSISRGTPRQPVRILQLGSQSLVAPKGRFIWHLSMLGSGFGASEDLKPVVQHLVPDAHLLFHAYYTQGPGSKLRNEVNIVNLAVCNPPDIDLGFKTALDGAQISFERLFPEKEFIPALPRKWSDYDSD